MSRSPFLLGLAVASMWFSLQAAQNPAPVPPGTMPQDSPSTSVKETAAPTSETEISTIAIEIETPKGDPFAAKFLVTCAGCHSLEGKKLTGPALNTAAT